MEGTRPNAVDYGGHPAPDGASPTQPYKCSQYVKIKVKINKTNAVLILNILTAFIRLGRAGPDRGRVPSIIIGFVPFLLIIFFDFG